MSFCAELDNRKPETVSSKTAQMPTDKINRTTCLKCLPKLEYVPAGRKEDDGVDTETVSCLGASVPDIGHGPASERILYTSSSSLQ